jgi:hypothetical protein
MIQPNAHRIEDLTRALNRCRQNLAETKNPNAQQIYGLVIHRYEKAIATLGQPPDAHVEKGKPAERPQSGH